MNVTRKSAACCVFNKQLIYVFGGYNKDLRFVKEIEMYHITSDTWQIVQVDQED